MGKESNSRQKNLTQRITAVDCGPSTVGCYYDVKSGAEYCRNVEVEENEWLQTKQRDENVTPKP